MPGPAVRFPDGQQRPWPCPWRRGTPGQEEGGDEGGDHLAAQAEAGVADVAETGAEHSSALAGVAARLAEARATHARMVADLEARAERAAEE